MDNIERINRIRLFRTKSIGSVTYNKLMSRFQSATKALENLEYINQRHNKNITPPSIDEIKAEIEKAEKLDVKILVVGDDDFPQMLTTHSTLPPVIFAKGHTGLLNKPAVSIVGARNSSPIAQRYAYRYAEELGKNELIIVSGMARGIDTSAHEGSLATGTIAVLGSCVTSPYPKENTEIYDKICNTGCVISEMPIGTKPNARLFAPRNRIIAGLSLGTLVVEAEIKSGSLLTANMANDMGRDVFAIPAHPTDSRGRGCNKIIKDGTAQLVEVPDDIISALNVFGSELNYNPINNDLFSPDDFVPEISDTDNDKIQSIIIDLLKTSPMDIDDIIRQSETPAKLIKSILLELELAEIISYKKSGLIELIPKK